MITALSGTSSDRNTAIISRNDTSSTATKKYGIRELRRSEKSTVAGHLPGDGDLGAERGLAVDEHLVAEAVDELGGGLVLRACVDGVMNQR